MSESEKNNFIIKSFQSLFQDKIFCDQIHPITRNSAQCVHWTVFFLLSTERGGTFRTISQLLYICPNSLGREENWKLIFLWVSNSNIRYSPEAIQTIPRIAFVFWTFFFSNCGDFFATGECYCPLSNVHIIVQWNTFSTFLSVSHTWQYTPTQLSQKLSEDLCSTGILCEHSKALKSISMETSKREILFFCVADSKACLV